MITTILTAFLLGFFSVGLTTWRTQQVLNGHPLLTFCANGLFSICYFFGTSYIVNRDVIGFISFSFGAGLSTSILAYRNKIKRNRYESIEERARSLRENQSA